MFRYRVLQELRLNVDESCLRPVDYAHHPGHNDVDSIVHKAYDRYLCSAVRREGTFESG